MKRAAKVNDKDILKQCSTAASKLENILPLIKNRVSASDYKALMMSSILLRIIAEYGLGRG